MCNFVFVSPKEVEHHCVCSYRMKNVSIYADADA